MSKTILALLAAIGCSSAAYADACKSVYIYVKNTGSKTVKVSKIKYYDDCDNKWRTENLSTKELTVGKEDYWTPTLEYVQSCNLSGFQIYSDFRENTGNAYDGYSWGNSQKPNDSSGNNLTDTRCEKGKKYYLTVKN